MDKGLNINNFKQNLGVVDPIQDPVEEVVQPTEENTVEPIEPTEEVIDETTPQETIDVEPIVENTPVNTNTEFGLDDELVNNYLSEKLGKEVTIEDLSKSNTNPLDNDPYLKGLYEWREQTGLPLEDYLKYQKNYDEVSDLDVAREFLQLEYPNSSPEEINLELRKFVSSEDDLEEDIASKNWELKKLAITGRKELNKLKADIKNTPANNIPSEYQEMIDFASTVKDQIKQNEVLQKDYQDNLNLTASSTESISLPIEGLDLNFLIPQERRNTLASDISDIPEWRNEDGSWNHQAVVNDGIKVKYFNDIIKLVYEQGISKGKDEIIQETGNVTLGKQGESLQPNTARKRPVYLNDQKSSGLRIGDRFSK